MQRFSSWFPSSEASANIQADFPFCRNCNLPSLLKDACGGVLFRVLSAIAKQGKKV
jgi:hypothetical protein